MVSGFRCQLFTLDPRPLITPSSLDTRPFLLLPRIVSKLETNSNDQNCMGLFPQT